MTNITLNIKSELPMLIKWCLLFLNATAPALTDYDKIITALSDAS
jgi:hypothetical protein